MVESSQRGWFRKYNLVLLFVCFGIGVWFKGDALPWWPIQIALSLFFLNAACREYRSVRRNETAGPS
jgi:hypothetical protein